MTESEIKKIKDELNWKYYGDECRIPANLKMPISTEDQIMFQKISIAEMMLSCLAYGNDYFEMTTESWYRRNTKPNDYDWDRLEKLGVKDGKQAVAELWGEMKADFKRFATVKHDTYTDCEGLSYNSVEWSR